MNKPIKLEPIKVPLKPDEEVKELIKKLYRAGYVKSPKINNLTVKDWEVKFRILENINGVSFRFFYMGSPLFDKYIVSPNFKQDNNDLFASGITLHVNAKKEGPYGSGKGFIGWGENEEDNHSTNYLRIEDIEFFYDVGERWTK